MSWPDHLILKLHELLKASFTFSGQFSTYNKVCLTINTSKSLQSGFFNCLF